jgi:hypothetical protein
MDAITKAISEIKFIIPREILNEVFIQRQLQYRTTPTNIDTEILAQVIRPRVLVDCDLIGGMEIFVPLANVPGVQVNLYTNVYNIPKSLTQNRPIISVLNITFNDPTNLSTYGNNATNQTSIALQVAQGVMDAQGAIPLTSTADVTLIGENTVMVRDLITIPTNCYLRCKIGNDDRMNHLQPTAYLHFAKNCEYAVKSFIHKELVVKMGSGQLQAGQLLGPFKEVVESYSDAEQNYQDHRKTVMQKLLLMSDGESYRRLLKLKFGGYR